MTTAPRLRAFEPNQIPTEPRAKEYSYGANIVSRDAPKEIDQALAAYKIWKWP